MPLRNTFFQIECRLFWPARSCLENFEVLVQNDPFYNQEVFLSINYDSTINIGSQPFVSIMWTRLDIIFFLPFRGDSDGFNQWVSTPVGISRLYDEAQRYQNLLIDHIKATHPYHADIDNLRHFGPSDWPYIHFKFSDQIFFQSANPSLRWDVASNPLKLNLESISGGSEINTTKRLILRSFDLVKFGYPTEAVLSAVAVLDATVQDCIKRGMRRLGLMEDSIEALLRNTTQARFATYLDPILKLICEHSLKEDDEALFDRLNNVNRMRNNSIHNGIEIKRSEAEKALCDIYDVLDYLKRFLSPEIILPPRPSLTY